MASDIATRVAIICVVSVFLCVRAVAQEGYYGVGHDRWHREFYSKLNRNDGRGTCCNLMDCRPTQSRMVGDHYEVKVDGEWTPVPNDRINNVVAPDGGAHVCAPRQEGLNKGVVFCVVLPPEGWTKARVEAVHDEGDRVLLVVSGRRSFLDDEPLLIVELLDRMRLVLCEQTVAL
jgi:hypothetical protein